MADSALIDDLERQFAENPRRVFARLANEYRKAGDAERAIEICRHHVPQQPGYISGHIVLGQALFDTAQYDESRGAFETALGLDPENLIALRQLGDIARETGDRDGARSWYRRLLEVDPQNDEVAEQLQALDTMGEDGGPAELSPSAPEQEQVHWGDIHPEDATPVSEGVVPAAPDEETPLPFLSLVPEPETEPATVEESGRAPEPAEPEIVLDTSALGEPPVAVDESAITATTAEEAAPPEPDQLAARDDASEPVAAESDEMVAAAASGTASSTAEGEVSETVEETSSDAFVTETMAELYVRQGFTEQALDIYRRLARQSPGEARFRETIAALEGTLAAGPATSSRSMEEVAEPEEAGAPGGPTIREFLSAIAARRARIHVSEPTPDGKQGQEAAELTPDRGDNSAHHESAMEAAASAPELDDELFPGRSVAQRDDDAAGALAGGYADGAELNGDGRGAPARAASDELSLDAVFRDAPSSDGHSRQRSSVSFDEFFANEGQSRNGDVPSDSGAQQMHGHESPPSDLELFHAWLEGLKK